jgi:glutamate 5-kinase
MIIANGTRGGALAGILAGKPVGTLFVPPRTRLTSKKWWIAYALRRPQGTIMVDAGAAEALADRGKSLLASGVRQVRGRFEAGAFVVLAEEGGQEFARGVSNFSSADLVRIRGLRTRRLRHHRPTCANASSPWSARRGTQRASWP